MSTTGGGLIILRHSKAINIRSNASWSIQNDSDYDVAATDADLDNWFGSRNPSSEWCQIIPGF